MFRELIPDVGRINTLEFVTAFLKVFTEMENPEDFNWRIVGVNKRKPKMGNQKRN